MPPLVAITCDLLERAIYMQHMVPEQYVDAAVDVAGVLPVLVPAIGARLDPDDLLDRVDGLLVTGAKSNVHPRHYGEETTPAHEPFDEARDATTLPLIARAVERGVPVLAICRGIQEMNVALGGSITAGFQDARSLPGHSASNEGHNDERFKLHHEVAIAPGSCLADVLGETARVNSLHTQALDRLGPRVRVEATAPDGTVEAIGVEGTPGSKGGFAVGVQWHPEYWAATDSASRKVLEAFGDACRLYADAKADMRVAAE